MIFNIFVDKINDLKMGCFSFKKGKNVVKLDYKIKKDVKEWL